jgi:hypothetical protein
MARGASACSAHSRYRMERAAAGDQGRSMAAIAELRAAAAEFRSTMEAMIAERLAQLRQPADGKEGPRGEAGPTGRIKGVRAYLEDMVHYEGDIVVHEGSTYQAKRDTSRAPPHADWACIAAAGRDAKMPKVCGTYREGETYKYLDVVALNGGSFIARADNPGPCPGDCWQLVASAGRAGKPGPNGERGEKGERGLPGQAGLTSWQIEPERYRATPLMSLSRQPGCPWPNSSTPAASSASMTALMVSRPLPSVADPLPSIAEIVVTLFEASLAS